MSTFSKTLAKQFHFPWLFPSFDSFTWISLTLPWFPGEWPPLIILQWFVTWFMICCMIYDLLPDSWYLLYDFLFVTWFIFVTWFLICYLIHICYMISDLLPDLWYLLHDFWFVTWFMIFVRQFLICYLIHDICYMISYLLPNSYLLRDSWFVTWFWYLLHAEDGSLTWGRSDAEVGDIHGGFMAQVSIVPGINKANQKLKILDFNVNMSTS